MGLVSNFVNIALEKATETEKTERITRKESRRNRKCSLNIFDSIYLEAEDTIKDIVELGEVIRFQ